MRSLNNYARRESHFPKYQVSCAPLKPHASYSPPPFGLPDNTAGVVTRRAGFQRRVQNVHHLPVVVEDSGYPAQSSTATLTIRVCACEPDGSLLSCTAEAVFLPMGLSTGAVMAVLLCMVILLGEFHGGPDDPGPPACGPQDRDALGGHVPDFDDGVHFSSINKCGRTCSYVITCHDFSEIATTSRGNIQFS